MSFNKVAILGMGLLGGSLGKALRRRRLAACVAGYARRQETVQACLDAAAVDVGDCDPTKIVANAELVVLCTPVRQMGELASRVLPHLAPDAVVTDVGSTKATVVAELETIFTQRRIAFVGGHPMAGSDQTGVAASREDLYVNARCVLTPTGSTDPIAVDRVRSLWESVGGRVLTTTPSEHDLWAARASHLPHMLASTLAHFVLATSQPPGVRDLCSSGFRDTTRLANGSPEMWRDIALTNRDEIRAAIAAWSRELSHLDETLQRADPAEIEALFLKAKEQRESWIREFHPEWI